MLWQIVATIASNDPENGDIFFAKWDIKNGFWQLVVLEENMWQFCFVLPHLCKEDLIEIVKPAGLLMGWCKSPPLFCTTSETAQDVAQEMIKDDKHLLEHNLECYSIPQHLTLPSPNLDEVKSLLQLLDIYMDNFLGLMQAPPPKQLEHFTWAVLHGIHKVFPLPGPGDDPDDKLISIKKLKQGDSHWAMSKEILGWFFNGVSQYMSLPEEKVNKIMEKLKDLTQWKLVKLG